MILLFARFKVRGSVCPSVVSNSLWLPSVSSSALVIPLNQPMPNSYGFARGEPFTLSMLSSFLGSRSAVGGTPWLLLGYLGVFGGSSGLKVEDDGTRGRVCRDIDGLAGDVGREGSREPYVEELPNGGLGFWGLGEGGTRPIVRG